MAGCVLLPIAFQFGKRLVRWFVSPCTISRISPKEAPVNGGTQIAITGVDFHKKDSKLLVKFKNQQTGKTQVVPGKFIDSTTITCIVPSFDSSEINSVDGLSNRIEVSVSQNGGFVYSNACLFWYYLHPNLLLVEPQRGVCTGGDRVMIYGERLRATPFLFVRFKVTIQIYS